MIERPELFLDSSVSLGALLWRVPASVEALASAPVGGDLTTPAWIANIRVASDYARTDLDEHAREVALASQLTGSGVTLFTAAPVDRYQRGESGGVAVDCTAGISKPTFAASDDDGWSGASFGEPDAVRIAVPKPSEMDRFLDAIPLRE